MQELELETPVLFTNSNKSFIYDFDRITIEQAELTRELLNFKTNQNNSSPSTFREVVKSSGADFTSLALSYLLREKNANGEVLDFNRDKVETEVFTFVKNLPMVELEKVNWCINNFFCSIKRDSQLSEVLQSKRKQNGMQDLALSMILQRMMETKIASEN